MRKVILLRFHMPSTTWKEFRVGEVKKDVSWTPCDAELPTGNLEGPTEDSNWLIPNRLLIGASPSAGTVARLLEAGIDVFVSLMGEYGLPAYQNSGYASSCKDIILENQLGVLFIHFPIRNFKAAPSSSLSALVTHLISLLETGHTLYVHCRGGHGYALDFSN